MSWTQKKFIKLEEPRGVQDLGKGAHGLCCGPAGERESTRGDHSEDRRCGDMRKLRNRGTEEINEEEDPI